MTYPMIMLGGVAIAVHAGPAQQDTERLAGRARVRMSDGAGVQMTHWGRASGTVSGSGLLPPGLDGLDYSQPLELRLTKPRTWRQAGTEFVLDADCRPDAEPWAYALTTDNDWVRRPCVRAGRVVTVTPLAGALAYQVQWMPVYSVFVDEPAGGMSDSHAWSFAWEEV